MLEKDQNHPDLYESDIDEVEVNREVMIRNKRFKIKEHLGLVKKVEVEGN